MPLKRAYLQAFLVCKCESWTASSEVSWIDYSRTLRKSPLQTGMMNNQLRGLKIESKESHTVSIQGDNNREIKRKKDRKTTEQSKERENTDKDQMLSLALTIRRETYLLHLSS